MKKKSQSIDEAEQWVDDPQTDLLHISADQIEHLFPYFIQIDRSFNIIATGKDLQKWPISWKNQLFQDFRLISPALPVFDMQAFSTLSKEKFVLCTVDGKLKLQGYLQWSGSNGYLLVSPCDTDDLHDLAPSRQYVSGHDEALDFADQFKLLSEVLDKNHRTIYITDESGRLIYINPEISLRFGVPRDECRQIMLKDLAPNLQDTDWIQLLKDLKQADTLSMEKSKINGKSRLAFSNNVSAKLVELKYHSCVIFYISSEPGGNGFEAKFNRELNLQEALIDIASTYINLDINQVEATLEQSLEKMGRFVEADRAYICSYDFEKQIATKTHSWCRENLDAEVYDLQQLPISNLKDLVETHVTGEIYSVADVQSLAQDRQDDLRNLLARLNILSLIAVPLLDNGELIGFVGFDSLNSNHDYSDKERQFLSLFGKLLVNIINRERYEKSLTIFEEKYRNLINNMNLGLLEVDKDDVIQFANQSFCGLSGFSLSELVGQKALDLLPVKDKELVRHKTSLREHGLSDSYEVEIYTKSGERRFWLISGAANYNDKGQHIGSIGVHLDITDSKMMEIELAEAKGFAEAAASAKDLFLANMSHEIRTPLNVIIGMIRMLKQENLTPRQKYYVNQSNSSARHLLTILNNVLDVAKIESGKLQLVNEYTSVSALVYNIHSIMFSQAKEKNIHLNLDYDPQINAALKVDSTRLRQVLLNLIGNAIKFTDSGKISISVALIFDTELTQQIHFEVSDTGIGMSPEFISQIFNKFSQEQNLANRKFEGTGLGMAISADLIKLMGGILQVKSKKGHGSRFWFDLILEKGDHSTLLEVLPTADIASFPNKLVLLVEDNYMNRLIARHSLENLHLEVLEAQDGKEAIEILEKHPCDLILMDIQMPIMDGVEATKKIRNTLGLTTPIIALTANAFKHDIDLYLGVGMNDYITKPYDERNFIQVITKNLLSISTGKGLLFHDTILEESNMPSDKLYDLTFLEEIVDGDQDFLIEMIQTFITQMSVECRNMHEALEKNDIGQINKIAHKIKPNVEQLGVSSLHDPIRSLEKFDANSSSDKELHRLSKQVCDILLRTASQLKILLDNF